MTRIIGFLEGANGPLNGRLYVKPGGAFIGAPEKDMSFKVVDGEVDIELPPCPPGMPYYVDWKNTGDISRLRYVERWRVPVAPEVTIEEVRGLVNSGSGRVQVASRKGDLLEAKMLRSEINELTEALQRLEQENANLLRKVTEAESRAAAAQAQSASLLTELSSTKQKLAAAGRPTVVQSERVIERLKTPAETKFEQAALHERIALLEQENEAIKEQLGSSITATTHFANLHAEIDRLRSEKQSLLLRIEELKRPVRHSSVMRNEAIANLDRIIS